MTYRTCTADRLLSESVRVREDSMSKGWSTQRTWDGFNTTDIAGRWAAERRRAGSRGFRVRASGASRDSWLVALVSKRSMFRSALNYMAGMRQ